MVESMKDLSYLYCSGFTDVPDPMFMKRLSREAQDRIVLTVS